MKTVLFILSIVILSACSPKPESSVQSEAIQAPIVSTAAGQPEMKSSLPDLGLAPELTTEVWLNTPMPLRISDLKGNVVMLEMWTYGCINCRNVIPSLKDFHSKYAKEGLVIIGNHFPEFDQERDLQNLTDSVKKLGILYPVAQDNDGMTWRAYNNKYWPTLYLIDKTGHIRYTHIGEGNYEKTEEAIQSLLAEK